LEKSNFLPHSSESGNYPYTHPPQSLLHAHFPLSHSSSVSVSVSASASIPASSFSSSSSSSLHSSAQYADNHVGSSLHPSFERSSTASPFGFALLDLGPLYRFFRVAYTPPVTNEASYIQLIFAAYSIFVHLVALGFPIRVSFACWQLTEKIEEAHARLARDLPFKKLQLDFGQLFRIDEDADEKSEVRTNSQSLVVHVIMIPCYKEDIENLKDTLRVLASHRDALNAYDVRPRIAFLLSSSQRLDTS